MKKIILLLAAACSIFVADAQGVKKSSAALTVSKRKIPFVKRVSANSDARHLAERTTSSVTFETENFGTGTSVSLPLGWTAGATSGGTWHWANMASGSAYSLGTINSATAGNGWMIFDADSIGTACSCAPAGWLQSPAYACDTDSVVTLNFQEYYEKLKDSCYVWVSADPAFTTYSSYLVQPNAYLADNLATANPVNVHINISSVAARQHSVYIRFVYRDNPGQAGGYSWMIDDMSLTESGPYDVGVSGSYIFEPDAKAYDGSVFNTPLAFVDSIYPVTLVSNFGAYAQPHVKATASINEGSTHLYSFIDTLSNLSLDLSDSFITFPAFIPADIGNYTCSFSISIDSPDANNANNTDNVIFNVTDTLWNENTGLPAKSYLLYDSLGGTAVSYMLGTRFDVPDSSAGDTVSGFGVAFDPASIPTTGSASVSVQLYSIKKGETGWTYVARSVARPVTYADISTPTSLVWADFRVDPVSSGGLAPFILHAGTTYAAVVQVNEVTTQLRLYATNSFNGASFSPGYFGQSDTSLNDGGTSFSPHSAATGIAGAVPMVQMYFGNIPEAYTAVKNITETGNYIGVAVPNPANTNVTIPFTMAQDAKVSITLLNALGQVMKTQNISAVGGQSMRATFATTDLPDGVYLYNVSTDGQNSNGRIVVAH